jgi:hypothetical protein
MRWPRAHKRGVTAERETNMQTTYRADGKETIRQETTLRGGTQVGMVADIAVRPMTRCGSGSKRRSREPEPEPSEISRLVAAWPKLETWANAVLGDRRYPGN